MMTAGVVALCLTCIALFYYNGIRSYRKKLKKIPRNCIKCGLPVREKHKAPESQAKSTRKGTFKERLSIIAGLSTHISDEGGLKREIGMSQAASAKLPHYASEHANCPTDRRVPSDALEKIISSNLKIWQARIKLRMNYQTYMNKCLKLCFL